MRDLPEDVPIPRSALGYYWSSHAVDPFDQEDIADTLAEASVVQRDATGMVRLHDLYHDYLRHRAGENLAAMHGALADIVTASRKCCELIDTSDWVLAHLPWHLVNAERPTQAKALLLNYHWLVLKLSFPGVQAVIADTHLVVNNELQLLGQVLRLSAHVLARDPSQFAAQLVGRLHDP